MLPEHDRQLLTAYVDGELGARQMRLVLKLLRRSEEARALLQKMQEHSRALRHLPRVRSHPALSDSVLQLIRARQLKPRVRPVAPRSVVTVWVGYAAAAAVLAVVCGASYLFFANSLDQPTNSAIANRDNSGRPKTTEPQPSDMPKPRDVATVPPEILPTAPRVEQTPIVRIPVEDPKPIVPTPIPDKPNDPVLTAPASELVELKMADIAAPLIVKLQEVDQANNRTSLLAELSKAAGFRVEFPCRNGTRAYERFQAVCKAMDIALTVDPSAGERLKHPHLRASYALYLEDVTPEDVARLLKLVAAEDKKPDAKKLVDTQFDRIVLVRMGNRDRKELSDLLGTDPTATGPLGTDLHKPVSDLTESQIAAALAGQGGVPPRPDGTKPAAKAPEHTALVVPYSPLHPAANSTDVKRFFDNRKPGHAGTVQLFLVIRETGS